MVPGEHALFADDAASFAAECLKLLDDDQLGRKIGANARRLAEQTFRRESVAEDLSSQLKRLVQAPIPEARRPGNPTSR